MSDEVLMVITAPASHAEAIARTLVEKRMAACVNQVPGLHSIFRWQGAVEEEQETLLIVKSVASRVADVEAQLRETHPYELPELVVLPVIGGSEAYLRWMREESA